MMEEQERIQAPEVAGRLGEGEARQVLMAVRARVAAKVARVVLRWMVERLALAVCLEGLRLEARLSFVRVYARHGTVSERSAQTEVRAIAIRTQWVG